MGRYNRITYYGTAMIAWGVSLATCLWLVSQLHGSGFRWPVTSLRAILGYYIGNVYLGSWIALVFAFVLKKLTGVLHLGRAWQWAVTGVVLSPLLFFLLPFIIYFITRAVPALDTPPNPAVEALKNFLTVGLLAVWWGGYWGLTSTVPGVATALTLYSVERAPRAVRGGAPGAQAR